MLAIIQLILVSLCTTTVSFVFFMPILRARKCGRYYRQFNRFKQDSTTPFGGGLCSLVGLLFGGIFATVFLKNDYNIFVLIIGFFTLVGAFWDIRQDNFSTFYHQNPVKKFILVFFVFFVFLIWIFKLKITRFFVLPIDKIYIQIPVMAFLLAVVFCAVDCSVQFGYDQNSIFDGLSPVVLAVCSLLLLVLFLKSGDEYLAFFVAIICGCAIGTTVFDLKPSQFKWGKSGSCFCGGCVCSLVLICKFNRYALLALLPLFVDAIAFVLDFVFFKITKKVLFKGHFLKTHLKQTKQKNLGEYKIIIIYAILALVLGIVNILKEEIK